MSSYKDEQQVLARNEMLAAQRMHLGGARWALIASVLLFVVYLFLPHAGVARGWEVVFHQPAADAAQVAITERIFADLLGLGIGVFTVLLLLTQRATFGLVAWMMVTVAFFGSIFAFWLRGASEYPAGVGMFVGVAAAGLATLAYSTVALRRSPEQRSVAQERAQAAGQLDRVGQLQSQTRDESTARQNIELVDDRRRQAARRHNDHL